MNNSGYQIISIDNFVGVGMDRVLVSLLKTFSGIWGFWLTAFRRFMGLVGGVSDVLKLNCLGHDITTLPYCGKGNIFSDISCRYTRVCRVTGLLMNDGRYVREAVGRRALPVIN